jgi:hypothetical protein
MNTIIRRPLAWICVLGLLATGCIISGQFVILLDWGGIASTDQDLESDSIDLTGDETWQDHKDDIQNIVDVKFEVEIQNLLGTTATGEVYLSENSYNSVTDVRNNAIRILHGIEVAGNSTRMISFEESAQFQENLSAALDLVETGQFYIYGIAENIPFSVNIPEGSRLLVTFSAGN